MNRQLQSVWERQWPPTLDSSVYRKEPGFHFPKDPSTPLGLVEQVTPFSFTPARRAKSIPLEIQKEIRRSQEETDVVAEATPAARLQFSLFFASVASNLPVHGFLQVSPTHSPDQSLKGRFPTALTLQKGNMYTPTWL